MSTPQNTDYCYVVKMMFHSAYVHDSILCSFLIASMNYSLCISELMAYKLFPLRGGPDHGARPLVCSNVYLQTV